VYDRPLAADEFSEIAGVEIRRPVEEHDYFLAELLGYCLQQFDAMLID
jgi:hypothetical protein